MSLIKRSVLKTFVCSLPFSATHSSSFSCENTNSRALTYSSTEDARNPTGFTFSSRRLSTVYSPPTTGYGGTTMSSFGPAVLCATTISPAAYTSRRRTAPTMYSTTQMPKCSFHMVCRPTRLVAR